MLTYPYLEDTHEYILYASQPDMMMHEVDTRQNVTKIMFLGSDGGAMEFIQDCHIHLFEVEGQIGQRMWKLELLFHSQRDIEIRRALMVTRFDKKL